MASTSPKLSLSPSRDIPLNKLRLSQSNVRRIKADVSIEELAEDIARRGLLQSLNVRPIIDADGLETGHYEVPAGGRRFRALQLLVKQKRFSKTGPVPCIVRDTDTASQIEANPAKVIQTDGNSPEAIRELRERQEQVRRDIEREQETTKQKDGPARAKPQS